ncbi:hypothetical protein AB0G00_16680 [Nocardia salmonicida]|uniref:hypothetical protein n=1 Tax=Nocardia salmonicida TaxID=53431 RepID=UPI0033EA180E
MAEKRIRCSRPDRWRGDVPTVASEVLVVPALGVVVIVVVRMPREDLLSMMKTMITTTYGPGALLAVGITLSVLLK